VCSGWDRDVALVCILLLYCYVLQPYKDKNKKIKNRRRGLIVMWESHAEVSTTIIGKRGKHKTF